jgi:hypothetical protein
MTDPLVTGGGPVRTRLMAAGAAVLTVAVGLGARAGMEGDIAKYAGDALYTTLVYALVVLAAPRAKPLTAAGIALGISWAVEFLQLSRVPAELSRRSVVARLVLGSTFHTPDLFWYAVGAALGWFVHAPTHRQTPTRPTT